MVTPEHSGDSQGHSRCTVEEREKQFIKTGRRHEREPTGWGIHLQGSRHSEEPGTWTEDDLGNQSLKENLHDPPL